MTCFCRRVDGQNDLVLFDEHIPPKTVRRIIPDCPSPLVSHRDPLLHCVEFAKYIKLMQVCERNSNGRTEFFPRARAALRKRPLVTLSVAISLARSDAAPHLSLIAVRTVASSPATGLALG